MTASESIGHQLRHWRRLRGLSQLDLAIQADVSARHISFVETGRTVPSAAMVLRLMAQLAVPLRERNRLLTAAGHAPVYRESGATDPDDQRVRAALRRILRAHEPYPAAALDRRWDVLLANTAFDLLTADVAEHLRTPPINMMRLGLHPLGLAARVGNLSEVRAHLLPRLAVQAGNTGDPFLAALHEELVGYGPPVEVAPPDPADIALTIRVGHRGVELRFITTITTFGTAFDIALAEVAVETFLPADDETARYCHGLAADRSDPADRSDLPVSGAM
ncbi:helix-turn-helix domain-containing protein [Catellatospora tritici]|uniref:helix-turn-helix domain-containing protein n=1 Tax=Catellatospora tritici TaxID=2851566 RepID=UPI001C2D3CF7|nr:helix-turn-helix transcriptional regulator [Catellatospora tritici]MBV1856556.1 helix-turn-helix transcriptional regulator [Catellatospora tritici]